MNDLGEQENNKEMKRLDDLMHFYALKVGLTEKNVDGEQVNEDYCRLLFLQIIPDYQHGQISVDDLSSLCERMWQKCSRYSDILLEGAELSWYLRWSPEDGAKALRALMTEFGSEWVSPTV